MADDSETQYKEEGEKKDSVVADGPGDEEVCLPYKFSRHDGGHWLTQINRTRSLP
jgi:hypothetical protein